MDILQAAVDLSLCRAVTVTPDGTSRAPLPIRAGRIGSSLAARAYRVDVRDHLIFPGLINAHEHLHVNAIPPLKSDKPFPNSYAWIAAFQAHFEDPAVIAALKVPKELRLRHGALKNLLAGTTCVAHHDPWHATLDSMNFPIALLRDYGWSYALGWPGYGPSVQESFAATPTEHPWMIHLAEGTDAIAQAELSELDRLGCLAANSVLVHGVGLLKQDIDRVIASDAAVVWCPTSNHALLGRSLDPRRLFAAGRLALGSDSRLSGARDLLKEMRGVAARGELSPKQILELVTTQAARILRLPARGSLAPGVPADLVIVEDRGGDKERSLVDIERSQIRAVVRNGVPCIADTDFADWFAAAGMEAVPVTLDGKPKLLARTLAEPALVALEPGLELIADRNARERDLGIEARSY
ncbi:amidohydrolase family protein [Rhodanobacter sp. MP7CTX1]|uniref:amidohydrolase family protein n=1 Tax=Rhodanobacter sp. MP7CTX1 TaxID=2723084 RepID=UPI00161BD5DB|nr:amidohydrolase family protein [Rhodanobacter sp. MP7CTX1]MBB6186040.1 cytosine/adenosine deaminase-related metal-dependent hydrolase [Rhodanobacter sp. MP7CTX1]